MLSDLRLAWRSLRHDRSTTTVAVLSLAIGLAANATVFSLVHAVEFPRLIYPDPSRLVFLETDQAGRGLEGMLVSAPDALDVLSNVRAFSSVAIAGDGSSILDTGAGLQRVGGRRVVGQFFDTFGVPAALGRTLRADDPPGTLVLSDGIWRRAFGSDPAVVGKRVRLDGGDVPIVGVMPPEFDNDADYWTPLTQAPSTFSRDDRQFSVFARLRPGATLTEATGELASLSATLASQFPATNDGWLMRVFPMSRLHGRDTRGTFFLLQAAVLVMLLIACANIANLLLARGTQRTHEMALRLSLGATRRRLISQLLCEGLVLSGLGGVLGVVMALWGIRAARSLGGFPDVITPSLNVPVIVFSAMLAAATGLLCAVWPAWRASMTSPEQALRQGGGRNVGGGRSLGRDGLVAVQITGALVLIAMGALLARSWQHRQQVELGFDPRLVVRASASPMNADTTMRLVDAVAVHPDIEAAAASTFALPTAAGAQRAIVMLDAGATELDRGVRRGFDAVTPGYFETMRIPVLQGRSLTPGDRIGSPLVAVIDETLAQRFAASHNPIGSRLRLGADTNDPVVTVVGIVGAVRRSAMHDVPVARVYVSLAQFPQPYGVQLSVRGRGDQAPVAEILRRTAHEVDRGLLLDGIQSLEADLAGFTAPLRLMTTMLTVFGVTGLALAALGVFGTTRYVTSQRIHELAVRSALGATRAHLVGLVYRSMLRPTLAGVVLGVIGGVFATRAIEAMLFGVAPGDPLTMATAAIVIVAVACLACTRPALAAASADPVVVLRRP